MQIIEIENFWETSIHCPFCGKPDFDWEKSDVSGCVHLLYVIAEGMYVYTNNKYSDTEVGDKYSGKTEGKADTMNHIEFNVITANDILKIGFASHIDGDFLK